MAKTGDTNNPTAGTYKPSCGHKENAINKGSTFPPCPDCGKAVTWTIVTPTK
jgi:predicted RNA-binding Zn-ribbon protein involved in translation (DUF1610 family)